MTSGYLKATSSKYDVDEVNLNFEWSVEVDQTGSVITLVARDLRFYKPDSL
jgi:hypothetical protein